MEAVWQVYERRETTQEMRPYVPGEDLSHVGFPPDVTEPELGGMIARNPQDYTDQWYLPPVRVVQLFKSQPIREA